MRYFVIPLFCTLFLTILINWYVDPLATWASHPYRGLPIPKGYIYTGKEVDERLLKKTMLELDNSATTFLFGSSRVMTWGAPHFGDEQHVLNLGVGGATNEDYLYLLRLMRGRSAIKRLFIEIAPWTFETKCADWIQVDRYEPTRDGAYYVKKLQDLVSYSILRESVFTLFQKGSAGKISPAKGNEHESGYFDDGRRHYSQTYLNMSAVKTDQEAITWSRKPFIEHLQCGVSEAKVENFCRAVMDFEKSSKSEVVMLFLPWNPKSSAELNRRSDGLTVTNINREIATFLKKYCGDVDLIDDTNLCPSQEFFDALHPRSECFDRVTLKLENHHTQNDLKPQI